MLMLFDDEALESSEIGQGDYMALLFASGTSEDAAVLLGLIQVTDEESFRVAMSLPEFSRHASMNLSAVRKAITRLKRGALLVSGTCLETGESFLMVNPCLCGELGTARQKKLYKQFKALLKP